MKTGETLMPAGGSKAQKKRTKKIANRIRRGLIARLATSNRLAQKASFEPAILDEDIFKLVELSDGGISHNSIRIINSSGIHTVRELVRQIRNGTFKVKGVSLGIIDDIKGELKKWRVVL